MTPFNFDEPEIKRLLRKSKQDFRFDQEAVKGKLMASISRQAPTKPMAETFEPVHAQETIKPHYWPQYAASVIAALVLLATTTGLAFASSKAKPGDKLYQIQKAQNRIVLSLPLTAEKKAQIRTDIAAQRIEDLQGASVGLIQNANLELEIDETQQSIDEAVASVPSARTQNSTKKDQAIADLVKKLSELSTKHEQRLLSIQKNVKDPQLKEKINQSLLEISATKARLQQINIPAVEGVKKSAVPSIQKK